MRTTGLACAALLLCSVAPIHAQRFPAAPDSAATDSAGTRIRLSGEFIRDLPVDSAEGLLRLLPGFIQLESGALAFRSANARYTTHVDGVPVVRLDLDRRFTPALSSLESISLISAPSAARLGAAALEYRTLRARDEWRADARVLSDALSPGDWSQRATRFELSAAGPMPRLEGVGLAVSSSLSGNRYRQLPAGTGPVYVASGIDTTITLPTNSGGEVDVVVPDYVTWDARELPLGNHDRSDVTAALTYNNGAADYSVRYYRASLQSMTRALEHLYDADAWRGEDDVAQIVSLSVDQPLPFGITGEAVLSHQRFDHTSGMLAPGWANANAQPAFGITTGSLGFIAEREDWPVNDAVIHALRSGVLPVEESSLTSSDDPLAHLSQSIPGTSQAVRLNPYAMRTGLPISGMGASSDVALAWSREHHWYGRGRVLKTVGSYHFEVGAEIDRAHVEKFGLPLASGVPQAHRENLTSSAAFIQAGRTMGAFRIDAGVRLDHRDSDRLLPRIPGFIWNVADSLRGDAWVLRPGTEPWENRLEPLIDCGGTATAGSRTNSTTGAVVCIDNFLPVRAHTLLSPRLHVGYGAGRITAWGSIGSYVEPNTIAAALRDLSAGTTSMLNPDDTDPVREVLAEGGIRFRTHDRSWIGAEAFRLEVSNPLIYRAVQYVDPRTGGTVTLRVAQNGEPNVTQGVELSAQQELASWAGVLARVSLRRTDYGSGIGMRTAPVQGSGIAWLDLGELNAPGVTDRILDDLTVRALGHFAEGTPFTLLENAGNGQLIGRRRLLPGGTFAEEPLSSRLPAQKSIDLRIAKGFGIAGMTARFVADLRNPFGFENVHTVFAETGTTSNDIYEDRRDAQALDEFSGLGDNLQDMVIDDWASENELNRHMLHRAEQRFGNGDGLYTVDEMMTTVRAYTALLDGPQWLQDGRRELRLGVEIAF